jgi:hypothetical protein
MIGLAPLSSCVWWADPRLLLGTVDSRGTVLLRRLSVGPNGQPDLAPPHVIEAAGAKGTHSFPGCGWAGLAFHPTQAAHLATVSVFALQAAVCDS